MSLALTVKQLIEALEALPDKSATVYVRGHACRDCWPGVDSVKIDEEGDAILELV